MLVQLDIDRLVVLHVHEMQRRTPRPDHLKRLLVGRVVKSPKLAIVDAEAILPDVQHTLLGCHIGSLCS
jgi:hypothetical protein